MRRWTRDYDIMESSKHRVNPGHAHAQMTEMLCAVRNTHHLERRERRETLYFINTTCFHWSICGAWLTCLYIHIHLLIILRAVMGQVEVPRLISNTSTIFLWRTTVDLPVVCAWFCTIYPRSLCCFACLCRGQVNAENWTIQKVECALSMILVFQF